MPWITAEPVHIASQSRLVPLALHFLFSRPETVAQREAFVWDRWAPGGAGGLGFAPQSRRPSVRRALLLIRFPVLASFALLVACGASPASTDTTPKPAPSVPPPPPAPSATTTKPSYPSTAKQPVVNLYRDVHVTDDYRWLEDWSDPNVQAWSEAENTFARAWLDATPPAWRDPRAGRAADERHVAVVDRARRATRGPSSRSRAGRRSSSHRSSSSRRSAT